MSGVDGSGALALLAGTLAIDQSGWMALTISEALQGQTSLQYAQAIRATSLVSGNTIKALKVFPRGYHARWEALKCKLRPAPF